MDKHLFDQLVAFLLPDTGDPDDRKAWIENALYGSRVLARINWRGAAYPFTVQLVKLLDEFGHAEADKPAVVMLLEGLRQQIGEDRQRLGDTLIAQVKAADPAKGVPTAEIAPPSTKLEQDE